MQAKVLTDDEARRVVANIARLPDLVGAQRMMVTRSLGSIAADALTVPELLFCVVSASRPGASPSTVRPWWSGRTG
jgi:hypothetical protein